MSIPDTTPEMTGDILKVLLRSEGRRRLLMEIARERVITTSELVRRTGLRRQTVNEYVKEFEEAGLVAIKKGQKPWIVIASEDLEYFLLGLPVATAKIHRLEYPCSWKDFPDCMLKRGELSVAFIWGARGLTVAKAHDAVGVPELLTSIIFRALDHGVSRDKVSVVSALDYEAVASVDVLERDIFLIGSGLVNLLTARLLELLRPPIRFEPPVGRELLSELTGTLYSAGDEVKRNAALLALLPNPWAPGRIAIVAAGIFRHGTRAALKALERHVRNRFIEDHAKGVPLRVIRATPEGEFDGFFE